jgi:hypothetical protein
MHRQRSERLAVQDAGFATALCLGPDNALKSSKMSHCAILVDTCDIHVYIQSSGSDLPLNPGSLHLCYVLRRTLRLDSVVQTQILKKSVSSSYSVHIRVPPGQIVDMRM